MTRASSLPPIEIRGLQDDRCSLFSALTKINPEVSQNDKFEDSKAKTPRIMTAEKWSAVLEIVSFFLVTVDLFGKTRLIALQKRLSIIANNLRSIEIAKSFWHTVLLLTNGDSSTKRLWRFVVICTLTISLGLLFVLGNLIISFLEIEFKISRVLALAIYQEFAGLIILLIGLVTLAYFFKGLFWFFEFFLDSFLSGIIFLITKFNLQGLMLVTGAILFLISKAIILFN